MNIFVLHADPELAARDVCDQHAVKMPLESVQMLCTALHQTGQSAPYKPCHQKHPCTVWAGSTLQNWLWLYDHAKALFREYTIRYNKEHASESVLRSLRVPALPSAGLTPFAQAMPDPYKSQDAVSAYRAYYRGEKLGMARWTRRGGMPAWL
jgi:hypothetical protein